MRTNVADQCEICGNGELTALYPAEMMYGEGGPFKYWYCGACHSTYQAERLDDYSRFYPQSYYSFKYAEPSTFAAKFRRFKRKHRNHFYYFRSGWFGKLLAYLRPCPVSHLSHHFQLRKNMAILEIGCGTGELLHEIADLGVKNVIGIDPFVPNSITYENGAKIFRSGIGQLNEVVHDLRFDLIMFNHSLEHSPTPFDDLKAVTGFLAPDGEVLIRIPVSGSANAIFYRECWASLDAPRHIYLFSKKSIGILASKCGMRVKRSHFEGTLDDFLISEQHKAGIALLAPNSYEITRDYSAFTPEQMRKFGKDAAEQNRLGTASQAGFILGTIAESGFSV